MRFILFISIIVVLCSCGKEHDNSIIDDHSADRELNNKLIIGDTTLRHDFLIPLKLTGYNGLRKDSIVTDTLFVDLNKNGKNEFTFIYVGRFINFFNLGTVTKPTVETVYLKVSDELMILNDGFDYGIYKTVNPSSWNDTLTWDRNWVWPECNFLYNRIKNEGIGILSRTKRFIAYKRPFESKWGWIGIELKYDDYLLESVEIEEFGEKQYIPDIVAP